MSSVQFKDRREAGRRLAPRVADLDLTDPVVLGLPRGGVPVAAEVAAHLGASLDVVVVRKVGAPGNPEYGLGAVGEGGVEILQESSMRQVGVERSDLVPTIERERRELESRLRRWRGHGEQLSVAGRTVVVVDDGIATGVTAAAAVEVLRRLGASRVVLAVPVAPPEGVHRLRRIVDDLVVLATPRDFMAVGSFYRDFRQVTDDEVTRLLATDHDRQEHT